MENIELGLFILASLAAAALPLFVTCKSKVLRIGFLAIPLFCLVGAVLWTAPDSQIQQIKEQVPNVGRKDFAGSDACRSCHNAHYDSWHKSYHRTMTQLANEQSVLAPFDNIVLESRDLKNRLQRVDDWFVVDMIDPDWEANAIRNGGVQSTGFDPPQVRLPIVMTTGSHHLQSYWVPSEHGNKVRLFPWSFHIDRQRWIPNTDSFIIPPNSERYPQVWNNSCIHCHSVAGDVGYQQGNWQTKVAELGISCEACHGPGAAHIRRHNNPVVRYSQHFTGRADPSIVNPARLSPTKASEVCGQCHSAFDIDASITYDSYRAGGDFKQIFKLADSKNSSDVQFWPDGTIRVGGREFSGMIESACYLKGEMSCLSCHSMHSSDPNKQLQESRESDHSCLKCHSNIANDVSLHTHHRLESTGSRCYNCHMPHTSYALLSAIRSHRIDSPNVAVSVESGKPNACNQCHIDRTLAWTSKYLNEWFSIPNVDLSEDERTIAASLLWLLRGDAVQRVLAAWTLGWQPALEASGKDWQAPFLAHMLDDPYSMVRYMAEDSLQKLAIEVTEYDYTVSPSSRPPAATKVLNTWQHGDLTREGLQVFLGGANPINEELLNRLKRQRDDRPITLNE